MDWLALEFMQRALLAAVITGVTAPAIGTYIVQRRLSLLGDGLAIGAAFSYAAYILAVRRARCGGSGRGRRYAAPRGNRLGGTAARGRKR